MIDQSLIDSIAFLDGLDKLIESKLSEYLNPEKIQQILYVDCHDLNKLIEQQAVQSSQSLFYNCIAAKMNSVSYMFEEKVMNEYLAHCREYASLYLLYNDRRDTKDSLNDAIVIIFNAPTADRQYFYASACYDASLKMKPDALGEYKKTDAYTSGLIAFSKQMYRLEKTYNEMIDLKSKMQYRKELAESLAESFKQLLIASSNIVKLRLMGSSYVPSGSLTEQQIGNQKYGGR